jgi:YaiO family outer membrane protein
VLPAHGQQASAFRVELLPFYHSLSNDYGHWSGATARLWYRSKRFTPVLDVSSQTRPEGSQQSVGLSSYIVFNDRFYTIVGMSTAPFGEVELMPRLRADAAAFFAIPSVPGLVLNIGVTEIKFDESDMQIASLGSILYRGPLILSGVLRLNRDGVGGDLSTSGSAGGQYGAERKAWFGGGIGAGREAYQTITATPFDVRFTSLNAFVFTQVWATGSSGFTARYDLERKLSAYTRHGFMLGYFVDF